MSKNGKGDSRQMEALLRFAQPQQNMEMTQKILPREKQGKIK